MDRLWDLIKGGTSDNGKFYMIFDQLNLIHDVLYLTYAKIHSKNERI